MGGKLSAYMLPMPAPTEWATESLVHGGPLPRIDYDSKYNFSNYPPLCLLKYSQETRIVKWKASKTPSGAP